MNLSWTLLYPGIFIIAVLSSLILTPLAKKIGIKCSLMDAPGKAKIHKKVKARSGGLAIYSAFMISI